MFNQVREENLYMFTLGCRGECRDDWTSSAKFSEPCLRHDNINLA